MFWDLQDSHAIIQMLAAALVKFEKGEDSMLQEAKSQVSFASGGGYTVDIRHLTPVSLIQPLVADSDLDPTLLFDVDPEFFVFLPLLRHWFWRWRRTFLSLEFVYLEGVYKQLLKKSSGEH
jgi:hypothetical protein